MTNMLHSVLVKSMIVFLNARKVDNSTKRICVCNTKRNVYIALREKFLPPQSLVHRLDFYNLNAEIDFADDSYLNFGGDLYMSKVRYLKKIGRLQFGRKDFTVEDVQNLTCCSQIKAAPFNRPTLYIENTTIGNIGTNGIDPTHLWATIVFKFVRIQRGMEQNAMLLHDNINVSISHSFFNNLGPFSIAASDSANIVMIKSTFNHSCHPLAFGARSRSISSTVILIGNRFLNVPQLHLDATWVINWFNFYERWNNDTFAIPNSTLDQNRIISIEFNTVDAFEMQSSDFTAFQDNNDVFNDNILSLCNCSLWKNASLPPLFQKNAQRCDAHFASARNGKCTLNLKTYIDKCHSKSEPDINTLCKKSDPVYPLVHTTSFFNLTFKALLGPSFDNPFTKFALKMIKENEADCLYRMQKVVRYSKLFTYTEDEFERDDSIEYFEECSKSLDTKNTDKHDADSKTKSGTSAKTVILIIFSVILTIAGGICVVYLLRKKVFLGSSRRYLPLNDY